MPECMFGSHRPSLYGAVLQQYARWPYSRDCDVGGSELAGVSADDKARLTRSLTAAAAVAAAADVPALLYVGQEDLQTTGKLNMCCSLTSTV